MTWSSSGSAATYPTAIPLSVDPTKYTVSLVFRLDPQSKIVYVTGVFSAVAPPAGVPANLFTAPLPAAFRPSAPLTLLSANSTASANLVLKTDGTATTSTTMSTTNGNQMRWFYFTDTTPA